MMQLVLYRRGLEPARSTCCFGGRVSGAGGLRAAAPSRDSRGFPSIAAKIFLRIPPLLEMTVRIIRTGPGRGCGWASPPP